MVSQLTVLTESLSKGHSARLHTALQCMHSYCFVSVILHNVSSDGQHQIRNFYWTWLEKVNCCSAFESWQNSSEFMVFFTKYTAFILVKAQSISIQRNKGATQRAE